MIVNKYIITPYIILNIIVNLLLLFHSYYLPDESVNDLANKCTYEFNIPLGYLNYSNTSYYCPVELNNNNQHNNYPNLPLGYLNYSNTSYYCPINMNHSNMNKVSISKFNHSYSVFPFYNKQYPYISNKMVPYKLYESRPILEQYYNIHYQFYFTLYCFCFVFYMGLV